MGDQGNGNPEKALTFAAKNKYTRMDQSNDGVHKYDAADDSDFGDDYDAAHHHRQLEARRSSTRKYVFACSVFASLNSVLLGYDVGVMSGAIIFIKEDLGISEVQVELLVGILSIMSLIGSLVGGKTSDAVGRKWTMALAALVFQSGAVVMTAAPSYRVLMVGRTLAGVGIGLGVMIAPVYIAEISPSAARGSLTSFPEIFINVGILLGYVSNYAFAGLPSHTSWRVMLAVGILPSVFIGFALCFIPESPRWLVMRDRADEARAVLARTNHDESEVELRLAEIQLAASLGHGDGATWREILRPSPELSRMLITGIGIQCFQQVTGIDATVYYSPEILRTAGIEDNSKLLAATVAVGVTKTGFILTATLLIDRLGRKPLLYASTVGMTFCLFTLGLTLSLSSGGGGGNFAVAVAILAICGNVAFFSVGMGPVCWVITTEIFPLKFRAKASALSAIGNRVCSGAVAMSFLSLSNVLTTGGTFLLFSAISAASVAFVWRFVPETKGKSLEQIELLFRDSGYEGGGGEVQLGDAEHLVQK